MADRGDVEALKGMDGDVQAVQPSESARMQDLLRDLPASSTAKGG